jgi:two-component system chemotaxis response regulator CheB
VSYVETLNSLDVRTRSPGITWSAGITSAVGIGASEGGFVALEKLVADLPTDFRLPVFIVLHIGSHASEFPSLLAKHSALPCRYAEEEEHVQTRYIYAAPPGCHMIVEQDRIHLTRGPRENWARPSVDVLFRSLAWEYAEGAIGVILSGGLHDGTAGLYELKRRGGVTIVQDPAEAEVSSMPQSAVDNVEVNYRLPLRKIAQCLIEISRWRSTHPARHQKGEGAMRGTRG